MGNPRRLDLTGWIIGSARATTAAALHFRGRCRGGASPATRAALLVNTFFYLT